MDDNEKGLSAVESRSDEITRFAESYESFNRIINSLQRKYFEIKDDFATQNKELATANEKLVDLARHNLAATGFLNGIMSSIAVGVIAVDQNGRITHFNPAASAMFGIPADLPIGKLYRDALPPGNPASANALRTAETAREVDSTEKKIELDDGTQLRLSVSTTVLRDDKGRPNGAVEVLHDLTKVKKMESEIARLNTLAALGEMAASIAHEVRNPLSGIAGFASLLEKETEEKSTQRRLVKKIIRGVNNLNDTITALLNYTKLEELSTANVNYDDYVKSLIRQYMEENPAKASGLKISASRAGNPETGPIKIDLDKLLMRQVFFNILNNAAEVTDGQATIEIKFNKLSRQVAVNKYSKRVLLGVDETVLETEISDDGPGVPLENIGQLFAPFFTTKQDGNGLGLAISNKIIKAHSGELFAESSSKKGTSFYIIIPTKI